MASEFENFDNFFEDIFKQKSDEINEKLTRKLTISMVGDVNCGKSSTINRLMEKDIVSVGAKPGETKEIREIVYRENIIFVDTPGLDDVIKTNSDITLKYYKILMSFCFS